MSYTRPMRNSSADLRIEVEIAALQAAYSRMPEIPHTPSPMSIRETTERLRERLASDIVAPGSDFRVHNLRTIAKHLSLSAALTDGVDELGPLLKKIARAISTDTEIAAPSEKDWNVALAVAAELRSRDGASRPETNSENLAAALKRLRSMGHVFRIADAKVDPTSAGFVTATAAVVAHLEKVGRWNALNQIEGTARAVLGYEFDQVLYGRNPANSTREPSIPFGFLRQLAVRLPDLPTGSFDAIAEITKAFEVARDVVALTDVETYGQYWLLGAQQADLGAWLAKATLHDHLFAQQQWTPYLTPLFLRGFFGFDRDTFLRERLGWGIADVVTAVEAVLENIRTSPGLFSRGVLEKKLPSHTVTTLLRDLVHLPPAPNERYVTPFAARSADLMFRPLLPALLPDTFTIPSMSAMGPAVYEAVAAALRTVLSPKEMKRLTGDGLERALGVLLRFRGIEPTIEAERYSSGKTWGECDLVLEDDQTIIFLECKAKPLTRAAMSGDAQEAILAYLQGVVAGQAQALQHETLLKRDGEIRFDNSYVLQLRGRDVVRLSVTLHDHGTLQDRMLFSHLASTLVASELTGSLADPSVVARIKKPNEILRRLRENLTADLGDADQLNRVWKRALPTASLSLGHIAAILVERNTVSRFAEALRKPTTFATGSVLKEYHYLRVQKLL